MAASIRRKWIGDGNIAGNGTHTFIWNNPPEVTVLGYFAYADPPSPGLTGTTTGEVGIVAIRHQSTRTGDNPAVDRVEIDIKNFRSTPCGFNLYQSWITGTQG
ncbi:MAG: hypothetical protein ABIQ01_09385 [Pseudolysinimonas sp.]